MLLKKGVMKNFDRKKHWENIYQTKSLEEVSWFQPKPETSLSFLKELAVSKTSKIIDVGGGDSFFADFLLELEYEDITVLDISESAINRAKKRLGKNAEKIKWIVSDVNSFSPSEKYDFWHDRAAFHFLTDKNEIENYRKLVAENISDDGILVIATFSENGPKKCSGIDIQQYSEETLTEIFHNDFDKIRGFTENHTTPFDTVQNFVYCNFRKK